VTDLANSFRMSVGPDTVAYLTNRFRMSAGPSKVADITNGFRMSAGRRVPGAIVFGLSTNVQVKSAHSRH
jgi:hypothetical protein